MDRISGNKVDGKLSGLPDSKCWDQQYKNPFGGRLLPVVSFWG